MRRDVSFPSQDVQCRGWFYVPDDLQGRAPAIVMANAISAIKEITLPGYAERFCAAGFVVLVFDYRHYGASDGEPRNHLDPHDQQQDIRNAITWLRTLEEVNSSEIGVWGISLGGVHALRVGAFDRRVKAVAAVATGLNTLEAAMGTTGLQSFLSYLGGDRDRRALTGENASYMPAVSMPGGGGVMAIEEAYQFYTEAMTTYAPSYENRITLESVENLIAEHSDDSVHLISPTALLMIHGEKDIIPVSMVQEVYERAREPKKLVVYDCLHTDLYVREPWLTQSADECIAWFNHYLHNPKAKSTVTQDIEKNKATIQRFYDATNNGDMSVYDEMFAPDFISYSSAAGGELRGPEAFKAANATYLQAFPDFKTEVTMLIAEKDIVMAYGLLSGTNTGEFLGRPPSGQKVTWTGIAIYRFNDEGKIDGRWQEFDGLGLFAKMGVIPAVFGGA